MAKHLFEYISWFCGMGCSDLGLQMAGGRGLLAVDYCQVALKTHETNLKGILTLEYDLTEASVDDLSRIIRAHAGRNPKTFAGVQPFTAPCQGFTRSKGRSQPDNPLNRLILVAGRLSIASPRSWLIFENVEGMLAPNEVKDGFAHEKVLTELLDMFREGRGLKLSIKDLKAYFLLGSRCGLAQKRKRLVLPIPPRGVPMPEPLQPHEPERCLRDVIGPGSGFVDPDLRFLELTANERRLYPLIRPGENLFDALERLGKDAPKILRRIVGNLKDKSNQTINWAKSIRRLSWKAQPTAKSILVNRKCPKNRGKSRLDFVHPTELRFLTYREMAELQEIPRDWLIHGDEFLDKQYEQIGNGFAPRMARMSVQAYVLGRYPESHRPGPKPKLLSQTVLRYPGSKRSLAGKILKALGNAVESQQCYYEPFVGGGAVALEVARRWPKAKIFLNDLDPAIAAYWRIVATGNKSDRMRLEKLLRKKPTRRLYERWKNAKPRSAVDRAYRAVLISRCSFNGYAGGGPLPKIAKEYPVSLASRFRAHCELLEGRTAVTCMHVREFLRKVSQDVPMYLDPPYWQIGSKYYGKAMNEAEHKQLAKLLERRSNWVMSYGDAEPIRVLYALKKIVKIRKAGPRNKDLLISA